MAKRLKDEIALFLAERTESDDPSIVAKYPTYAHFKSDPSNFDKLAELSANGASARSLMKEFNISKNTFYKWKNVFPEFKKAIDEGKVAGEENLLQSLMQLATGAVEIKETKEGYSDEKGSYNETVTKGMAPNFQALKYALQLYDREHYVIKDKSEMVIQNDASAIQHVLKELDTDMLVALQQGKDIELDDE